MANVSLGSPLPVDDNAALREALRLIKINIDLEIYSERHNRELHQAVQIIVTVARRNGMLLEHGGK